MRGMTLLDLPVRPGLAAPADRRAPAAFPSAPRPHTGGAPLPAVSWLGGPATLRESVADHVAALGALLSDADGLAPGAEVRAELCGITALGRRRPLLRRSPDRPLLVVAGAAPVTEAQWEACLEAGAQRVLRLPEESERLLDHLVAALRPRAGALLVGVVGGCGGAGASSLAARLAGAAARAGLPVVLVDADPLGGGLDLLVEADGARGVTWQDVGAIGTEDGTALREGLPLVDGVSLLAAQEGPMPPAEEMVGALAALRSTEGLVVVDLGQEPATTAMPLLDRLLVVVPSSDHALRAARRRLAMWGARPPATEIVVRGRGGPSPREIADELGLPVAGCFRDGPDGAVPLLDRRRGGADRLCRDLVPRLRAHPAGEAS